MSEWVPIKEAQTASIAYGFGVQISQCAYSGEVFGKIILNTHKDEDEDEVVEELGDLIELFYAAGGKIPPIMLSYPAYVLLEWLENSFAFEAYHPCKSENCPGKGN